ncbi:cysteine synthase A [Burkholderia multivorans]|uniref:cysteine synthase A n=1 Tax=Burkholderia multivorans TaxID=87883 RepID=UPI0009BF30F8|nr:cysteine synthase A [Burkholderia multivorans]
MDNSVTNAVGNTPLVHLRNLSAPLSADIYLKLEFLNPWMSVKDRVALNIIETAEREGKLKPGTHVIEATSGNTGISLAGICAAKGYEITIVLPEFVSLERKLLLRLLGANIVLTPERQGLLGPVAKSFELAEKYPSSFIADQTRNPANPEAHFKTGAEILEQLNGKVDVFVAASGTGGHITGIGTYLKKECPGTVVVAVEPKEAAVLSGQVKVGEAEGNHGIIGIGPGFIPETLNREIVDRVAVIETKDGYDTTLQVVREEGLLVGVSTGAALNAAMQIANEPQFSGKNIVVVAASSIERYLSTRLTAEARDYLDAIEPSPAPEHYMASLVKEPASN